MLEQPTYKVNGYSFDSKQLAEALTWYKDGQYDAVSSEPYINVESRGKNLTRLILVYITINYSTNSN